MKKKKTYLAILVCLMLCCSCTPGIANRTAAFATDTVQLAVEEQVDLGNVLVVYYSSSGKTKEVAEIIRKKTNATLFRIETVKNYSSVSVLHALDAKKELESGNLPELAAKITKWLNQLKNELE